MRYSFKIKEYHKLGKKVIEVINQDTSYRVGFIGVGDYSLTVFADFGRSLNFSNSDAADIDDKVGMLNEQFYLVDVSDLERDTEITRIMGL